MKICMIGTGYVGLVSGACFADLGNTVYCVDKDKEKIALLNNNQIPIFEPGLKELVNKNYLSGRLKFTTDLNLAAQKSDIVFIDDLYKLIISLFFERILKNNFSFSGSVFLLIIFFISRNE